MDETPGRLRPRRTNIRVCGIPGRGRGEGPGRGRPPTEGRLHAQNHDAFICPRRVSDSCAARPRCPAPPARAGRRADRRGERVHRDPAGGGPSRARPPNTDGNHIVNAWGLTAVRPRRGGSANNGTNRRRSTWGGSRSAGRPGGRRADGHGLQRRPELRRQHGARSGPVAVPVRHQSGLIRGWNPGVPPPPPSTKAFTVVDRGRGRGVQGPRRLLDRRRRFPVRHRLPQPARGRVRRREFDLGEHQGHVHDLPSQQVRAVRNTEHRREHLRDVREGRPAAGRPGRPRPRVRRPVRRDGRPDRAVATHGAFNSPWGLAMAPADFGRSAETCWWELRQRKDERLWSSVGYMLWQITTGSCGRRTTRS